MYIYATDKRNTDLKTITDNRQIQSEKPVSVRPVTDSLKAPLNYGLQTAPAFFAPSPALYNSCAPIQRGKGKKKRIEAKKKRQPEALSETADTSSTDAGDTSATDEEEDQVKEMVYNHASVCALYKDKICSGDISEFENRLPTDKNEEFYQLLTEVIQKDSAWVIEQGFYDLIDICDEINLESYEKYGIDIFIVSPDTRTYIKDNYDYLPYMALFTENWFIGNPETVFFTSKISDLNHLKLKTTEGFHQLLISDNAVDLIKKAPTLSSWFCDNLINAVISIGCDTLVSLNQLYPSAANHKIPILAHSLTGKLPSDKIIVFFRECHNLGLNEDSIERVLQDNPEEKRGQFLVKKSEILTMLDKNRSFPQWIHALNNLIQEGAVTLEKGRIETLRGEPITRETVIHILDPGPVAYFVIHAHPGVGKADIKNPYSSACHLKPVRSGDVRLDEVSVPAELKGQLDPIFRELKKKQ